MNSSSQDQVISTGKTCHRLVECWQENENITDWIGFFFLSVAGAGKFPAQPMSMIQNNETYIDWHIHFALQYTQRISRKLDRKKSIRKRLFNCGFWELFTIPCYNTLISLVFLFIFIFVFINFFPVRDVFLCFLLFTKNKNRHDRNISWYIPIPSISKPFLSKSKPHSTWLNHFPRFHPHPARLNHSFSSICTRYD